MRLVFCTLAPDKVVPIAVALQVAEERDQNDDGDGHAEEQKQNRPHGKSPLSRIPNGQNWGRARLWQTAAGTYTRSSNNSPGQRKGSAAK